MKNLILCFVVLIFTACATIGEEFSFSGPQAIAIGKTTQKEIIRKFGKPFRVGFDSGKVQWTYAYYHYRVFGDTDTKDLVITFDDSGTVTNYIYNSSLEEDKMKIMSK